MVSSLRLREVRVMRRSHRSRRLHRQPVALKVRHSGGSRAVKPQDGVQVALIGQSSILGQDAVTER